MRLFQLLWVSARPAKQRTAFGNLTELILETDQVVFEVVDFMLDLLRPVGGDFG